MKSQIKAGAVFSYINMIVNIGVTFIYTPFMLEMMGKSEYGLYSLVYSVIAYLSVLDMGFGNAMVRFVSKNQARGEKKKEHEINGLFLLLYLATGLIALIIGLVLFLNTNNLFGNTLNPDELAKTRIIMLILIGTVSLSFPLSVFDSYAIASERFVFLKVLDIIKHLAIPGLMIPILFMGGKSISMVIVTSAVTLGYHIVTMVYCFKKLKMRIKLSFKDIDKSLLKSISAYSFWVFLNIIIDNLYNNTDQVILGSVCGTAMVAVYSIAAKISSTNVSFSTAISGLFLPKITKTLEEKDGDRKVSDIFIKVSRLQMYIMMLILAGFTVFGRFFIRLWVGDDYMDAYYIILLLIGPAIIPLTQNIGISIIQAKNKHQFRSIVYLIIAIINIAISIPLAMRYGGIGAAIGTALANIAGQIITMNIFYWKKIHIDIPKYWKNMILFSIPVAILTAVAICITKDMEFGWLKLTGAILAFAACYGLIVLAYANKSEKQALRKILRLGKKQSR